MGRFRLLGERNDEGVGDFDVSDGKSTYRFMVYDPPEFKRNSYCVAAMPVNARGWLFGMHETDGETLFWSCVQEKWRQRVRTASLRLVS